MASCLKSVFHTGAHRLKGCLRCSFCCSFTRWFRLFLLNLFFVGSLSFWCRGWSGILFIFSAWIRSLACLLPSSGSTPAVFSISAIGVFFFLWRQGLSSSRCSELCPVCWCASWQLSLRRWTHIPKKAGQLPCRRYLESWSWHPSVFQTISSGQQAS